MAGCDSGQAGFSLRASPLTMLAHVGEPREVEGRGEVLISWYPAGPAGRPATPRRGSRGGRGVHGELTAMLQECRRGEPHPTGVSSELNVG
jgi:hypothetical protein